LHSSEKWRTAKNIWIPKGQMSFGQFGKSEVAPGIVLPEQISALISQNAGAACKKQISEHRQRECKQAGEREER